MRNFKRIESTGNKFKMAPQKAARIRNCFDLRDIYLYRVTQDKTEREYIFEKFLRRYTGLIVREVRNFIVIGYEFKDLMQEALMVTYKVIDTQYKIELKCPFWPFLRLCIKRRLYSLMSSARNYRNHILNNSIELERNLDYGDIERPGTISWVNSHENEVIDRIVGLPVIKEIKLSLTDLEYKSFFAKNAYMLTYNEISEKYGFHPKQIDNALRRADKKIQLIVARMVLNKRIAI